MTSGRHGWTGWRLITGLVCVVNVSSAGGCAIVRDTLVAEWYADGFCTIGLIWTSKFCHQSKAISVEVVVEVGQTSERGIAGAKERYLEQIVYSGLPRVDSLMWIMGLLPGEVLGRGKCQGNGRRNRWNAADVLGMDAADELCAEFDEKNKFLLCGTGINLFLLSAQQILRKLFHTHLMAMWKCGRQLGIRGWTIR